MSKNTLSNAQQFLKNAEKRAHDANAVFALQTAIDLLDVLERDEQEHKPTLDLFTTAYSRSEMHFNALLYPICHATKLAIDIIRLAVGALLYLQALCEFDDNDEDTNLESAIKKFETGLRLQAFTVLMDLINAITLTASLLTRTLVSCTVGYQQDFMSANESLKATAYCTFRMFNSTSYFTTEVSNSMIDKQITERTFAFN